MKKTELERFRLMLGELTARVDSDAAAVAEQTRGASGGQGIGELSNAPMHLGDMGTEEFLHGMNAALLENEEYLSHEVSAALGRIQNGTYGLCEGCEKPILKERLEAVPYARFCVPCAEQNEDAPRVNLNSGRPQSPADTLASTGDMNEGKRTRKPRRADVEPETNEALESGDVFAAGTPGGGTAIGGLAGSNIGAGEPEVAELDDAMGSDAFDQHEARQDEPVAHRNARRPPASLVNAFVDYPLFWRDISNTSKTGVTSEKWVTLTTSKTLVTTRTPDSTMRFVLL